MSKPRPTPTGSVLATAMDPNTHTPVKPKDVRDNTLVTVLVGMRVPAFIAAIHGILRKCEDGTYEDAATSPRLHLRNEPTTTDKD